METLSPDQMAGATPLTDTPAAAAPAAPAPAPSGGAVQLSADELAGAKPVDDKPAFMAGRGGGYDDVQLAPTEAASESKVPGHQGDPDRGASLVPEMMSVLDGAKEGFRGLGREALSANRQLSNIIQHPIDTLGDERFRRETMRGVNDTVMPFVGNKLVAAVSGPPVSSAEDEKAFPDARALGGVAGMAVPVPYGEIAAAAVKPAKAAARGLLGAVERAGAGAEERQVGRAVEDITEGANKKARLGLEKSEDKVEALARENPEIVAHARDNDALVTDAQNIRKRASEGLSDLYATKDAEAAAEPLPAGLFGKDAASAPRAPGVRLSEPVTNMDASIAKLEKGDPTERLAAKELKRIRDELTEAKGADAVITAKELRAEQSARQTLGYAKAMPGMPDFEVTNAKILANRQASKDIGDSIVKHVTGMNYAEAKAAAAADPTSIAGRLFKLNGEVEGASRIEAAIASKKGRAKGGIADLIHTLTSRHGKHAGALGTAALAAHELGLHSVAGALGTAAGVAAVAPKAARYADNAIAAAGRGAEALSAKITPQAVGELIDLARSPATTYADLLVEAEKRNVPAAIAARVAYEAGKAPSAVPMPAVAGPAFAQQGATP